jgi:hypothetical protein
MSESVEASSEGQEEAGESEGPSFLQWTPEEQGDEPIDMSLPDFPSIDIPTLEEEDRPKK